MDIETIKKQAPLKIPETPMDVSQYLMMGEKGRADFNEENPNFWAPFDSSFGLTVGFFSVVRSALHNNMAWVEVLNEEMRKPEHRAKVRIIADKIKEFYQELYVGPMIGALPYFRQWAIPKECVEPKTAPAWTD